MKKKCPKCRKNKDVKTDYYKAKYLSWCIDCRRELSKKHKKENSAECKQRDQARKLESLNSLIAYLKEHPCVDCGEDDTLVLDFDHVDPSKKIEGISVMLGGYYGWEAILKEIEKCVVRCANCHRRRTAQQRNSLHYQLTKVS